MSFHFRPAQKSEAKPLIGLYSESGCGKTIGALLLAKGFCGDMSKVLMIETESGRGEAFANDPVVGGYQVYPIREEFSPKAYGNAITEAGQAGFQALIIDSASHEWEGASGVLSMAAKNQETGKKGVLVWQLPKLEHQREFVLKMLQTPVPLVVVCMRAKYPMIEVLKDGKKEWQRSTELDPKQSEDILFEMMWHAWFDKKHICHVTKAPEDGKSIFTANQMITVETGQRLKAWAAGASNQPIDRYAQLSTILTDANIPEDSFCEWLIFNGKITVPEGDNKASIKQLPADKIEQYVTQFSDVQKAFATWRRKQAA